MRKLAYLCRSLTAQFDAERFACPNCGGVKSAFVDQKYFVTQLRRCRACELLFRIPTDPAGNKQTFYDRDYSQGATTETPSDDALDHLMSSNFRGSELDHTYYIEVLHQLGVGPGDKVFDFGCSWGYESFQLTNVGFDVVAYELAPQRKRYAQTKLGVRMVPDIERACADSAHKGCYDCFFSAHVIEHVPSPRQVFAYAFELLRDGGLFVSFTPNGSFACRARSRYWRKLWGQVHPNFIDDRFLERSFANSPRVLGSSPVRNACLPKMPAMQRLDDLSGIELLFAARKLPSGW